MSSSDACGTRESPLRVPSAGHRMTPADAQRYCTALTKRSGSNFYYSFFFLPRERRDAMYTVYAFCREVDSAVDDPPPGSDPHDAVRHWRAELAAAYHGQPTHPVTISLAEHARRLEIPQQYFDDLISGVEMDLTTTRYRTFDELYLYCYRVACVVGLICLHVFGTRNKEAEAYAIHLGLAFQLTNILRDVGGDAAQGRIYLPLEDLARFDYREDALLAGTYSPQFEQLMRFECARARDYYAKAAGIIASLPPGDQAALLPAEIMRGVYARILDRVEQSGYRVFGPRISLPPLQRLGIAAGLWLRAKLGARP